METSQQIYQICCILKVFQCPVGKCGVLRRLGCHRDWRRPGMWPSAGRRAAASVPRWCPGCATPGVGCLSAPWGPCGPWGPWGPWGDGVALATESGVRSQCKHMRTPTVAGGDFWACATTACRTRIGTPCQLWYLPESKIPFEGCSSYSADLSKVAEFGAIDVTIFWQTGRQDSKSKPTKYVCFFCSQAILFLLKLPSLICCWPFQPVAPQNHIPHPSILDWGEGKPWKIFKRLI